MSTEEKPLWLKTSAEDVILEVSLLHLPTWLQLFRLRPRLIFLETDGRVPDLSDLVCRWHADCREQWSRNLEINAEPSWNICNAGTRTSPTNIGYADRVQSEDNDTSALLVQLHTKGFEVLQHGEYEANTNPTSYDNLTIEQRLSTHRRGEKEKWKDTLYIGRRKYHVRNDGDLTWSCTCRQGSSIGTCQT